MRLVAAILATGLGLSMATHAAPFPDPTRPPPPAVEQGPRGGNQLESILIAPDRRVAVIDGQQVSVGSRIALGEVVRITESEVVVRGPEGERALKLLPSFAAPAKAGQKRTEK